MESGRILSIRLLCLIFLFLVFGYWIFIAGVVNVSIPEGSVGVVYTSTHGYGIIPEKMVWSWKKIIPLNYRIYAFDNSVRRAPFTFSGFLPSASTLLAMPQFSQANFRYTLEGNVQYRLSMEGLLSLLSNHYLKADDLPAYYTEMDKEIQNRVNFFLSTSTNIWTSKRNPTEELLAELKRTFPLMEFLGIVLDRQEMPNIIVYRQAMDFLNVEHQLRLEARKTEGQKNIQLTIQQEQRLKLLERYGTILSRHPILVSFFAVDQGKLLPRDLLQSFLPNVEMITAESTQSSEESTSEQPAEPALEP